MRVRVILLKELLLVIYVSAMQPAVQVISSESNEKLSSDSRWCYKNGPLKKIRFIVDITIQFLSLSTENIDAHWELTGRIIPPDFPQNYDYQDVIDETSVFLNETLSELCIETIAN